MDKWTRDTWLDATLVESYEDSEDMTMPAAQALIQRSGVLSATDRPLKVLDNGSGMGQITESLYAASGSRDVLRGVEIVCGDVDDGLLDAIRVKKVRNAWSEVQVAKIDATDMTGVADSTYDYVFGNFLYFLVSNPVAALQETLRTLKPNGIIAFTTWSLSGPFALLQLAQAQMADYPLAPPNARLLGSWNHPRYVTDQLTQLGYTDIVIKPYAFKQTAASPKDMARKMRHVILLHTLAWGAERRDKGWELGQMIGKVLEEQQGVERVEINSAVLLITARKAKQ